MARDLTPADPTPVLDLLEMFRRSKVLFAAVKLGVFDRLDGEPKAVADLAAEIGANEEALRHLLGTCVSLSLLEKQGDRFVNTPTATAYLTSTSPARFTGYIHYSNDVMWPMWAHLEEAVREGGHRWRQTFGWDGPIFSNFFKTDEARREFLMGMNGFGVLSSPQVVNAFDLTRFHRMVDLGAATGHLVIAACERYPQLSGTAYDLPEALDLARELTAASPARDRLTVTGGDFFQDPLPRADLYALGRIIHDWSEPKIEVLLKKICDALPEGGGLLIAEKILNEEKTGPRWGLLQSLNMMVCTEGRERTLTEYEALLHKAGFRDVAGKRLPVPIDAILAMK